MPKASFQHRKFHLHSVWFLWQWHCFYLFSSVANALVLSLPQILSESVTVQTLMWMRFMSQKGLQRWKWWRLKFMAVWKVFCWWTWCQCDWKVTVKFFWGFLGTSFWVFVSIWAFLDQNFAGFWGFQAQIFNSFSKIIFLWQLSYSCNPKSPNFHLTKFPSDTFSAPNMPKKIATKKINKIPSQQQQQQQKFAKKKKSGRQSVPSYFVPE